VGRFEGVTNDKAVCVGFCRLDITRGAGWDFIAMDDSGGEV
jgi:hypothetical protein